MAFYFYGERLRMKSKFAPYSGAPAATEQERDGEGRFEEEEAEIRAQTVASGREVR
jgi:hypothetical protein